nr:MULTISPECIES: hypothetical protein [Salipiger]
MLAENAAPGGDIVEKIVKPHAQRLRSIFGRPHLPGGAGDLFFGLVVPDRREAVGDHDVVRQFQRVEHGRQRFARPCLHTENRAEATGRAIVDIKSLSLEEILGVGHGGREELARLAVHGLELLALDRAKIAQPIAVRDAQPPEPHGVIHGLQKAHGFGNALLTHHEISLEGGSYGPAQTHLLACTRTHGEREQQGPAFEGFGRDGLVPAPINFRSEAILIHGREVEIRGDGDLVHVKAETLAKLADKTGKTLRQRLDLRRLGGEAVDAANDGRGEEVPLAGQYEVILGGREIGQVPRHRLFGKEALRKHRTQQGAVLEEGGQAVKRHSDCPYSACRSAYAGWWREPLSRSGRDAGCGQPRARGSDRR